ncbi:tRNA (cytosine(38)-C(5))-methyltransferase [Anthonomus grandis grandis]|uniref:tRNA (cytosine(38)-C(5))-methyltransferase n=1 Tax=Anthonomus grandis grandis TaxID=2921223 RepID=UPI002165D264|nr:tRNA (cytosine(38)-C(5))-methyltransferase [Anthonomus grandis grandis]
MNRNIPVCSLLDNNFASWTTCTMNILELYSGIGGMHMAFTESKLPGKIKAAIEINPTANTIYSHNFPETKLINCNIGGLTTKTIKNLDVNTILMSPPCQPFTRNGKQCDIKDPRTDSFQHLLNLLPDLNNIENVLMENVKGFESSQMRNIFIKTLKNCGFVCQEFILSPSQIGVPNSRHRYYCLAKKLPAKFKFETSDQMMETIPFLDVTSESLNCFEIQDILDNELDLTSYLLPERVLKRRLRVLDVCYRNSKRSCCFTKSYGRFIEGTGSVFTENQQEQTQKDLKRLKEMNSDSEDYIELAQSLHLRFFTPKEVSRLMSFPETFSFPSNLSNRQKYMVLGNSINVKVVTELIKLLS